VLIALLAVAATQEYARYFPAAVEPVAIAQGGQTDAPLPPLPPATDANLNQHFEAFFASEANRVVSFVRPQSAFDMVFIHVCSLAWADLTALDLDTHPLFRKFNVLFSDFNSAATYSGPAVIRLLRGNCGQRRHGDLYGNDSQQCFTFDALRQAGFDSQWLMNHDGHYDNFRDDVAMRGGLGAQPLDYRRAAITMHSFDNTPIHDDYDVLSHWWSQRLVAETPQVALYYNSISLHDGNKVPGGGGSQQTYPRRAAKVLDEIDRFVAVLESSGRKVVVVMVPEHGAALSGDSAQISGMREIPTPQITRVPVGVKFIGMASGEQQVVKQPTSYLGLMAMLSKTMAQYRAGAALNVADLVSDLPATPFVAENEEFAIMQYGAHYYSRSADGVWVRSE
jgi:cellulose synthase operon protein YhjU